LGNAGDVEPVGGGISELRIDYGPGYRVYFKRIKKDTFMLLCDGTKASQAKDIASAKSIADSLEE
jgi:putative addiction module killer protein